MGVGYSFAQNIVRHAWWRPRYRALGRFQPAPASPALSVRWGLLLTLLAELRTDLEAETEGYNRRPWKNRKRRRGGTDSFRTGKPVLPEGCDGLDLAAPRLL
jgi:hypothetical protein